MTKSRVMRGAAIAVCVAGLSACQTLFPPPRNGVSPVAQNETDEAMSAFYRGNYDLASRLANDLKQKNPTNAYALLILAEIAENTGQAADARRYYAILAAMNPQGTVLQGAGPSAQAISIGDFAEQHLTGLSAEQAMQQATAKQTSALPVIQPVGPVVAITAPLPPPAPPTTPDGNIIMRFETLNQLLADGLISQDEYNQRRSANLGALLPDVAPPPAAGLGRPAPAPQEVEARLRDLVTSYQNGEISADVEQAERSAILDGLLPANPAARVPVTPRAGDQMEAAAGVGRLQRLADAKLITPDEMAQERAALYAAIPGGAPSASSAAPPALPPPPPSSPQSALPPPTSLDTGRHGDAVKLASYRTEALADRGWTALRHEFPNTLGPLSLTLSEEKMKSGATYYRIVAGPVADRTAAEAVCEEVRARKQYCVPTTLD